MTDRNDNNSLQRCAGVRETSLGVLSAGGIPIRMIGRFGCGRGSVGYFDRLRVCGAVIVRGPPGSHVHPPSPGAEPKWYQNDRMNLLF